MVRELEAAVAGSQGAMVHGTAVWPAVALMQRPGHEVQSSHTKRCTSIHPCSSGNISKGAWPVSSQGHICASITPGLDTLG